MLIKNASLIITQNKRREILRNKDILIEEGIIVKIGRDLKGNNILDAKNKLIMPGMINLHTHLPLILLRGFSDNKSLFDWANKLFPFEKRFTKEDISLGTLLSCVGMIKSGTTCMVSEYYFSNIVAKSIKYSGIRGFISETISDRFSISGKIEDALKMTESLLKEYKNDTLIRPFVMFHSLDTCNLETIHKTKELAERYNVLLGTHFMETYKQIKIIKRTYKSNPIEILEKNNLLDKNLFGAHIGCLTNKDLNIIKKRKVKLVHCPVSNAKLMNDGLQTASNILNRKILLGLGTDSPASNNSLDLFEEMKSCILMERIRNIGSNSIFRRPINAQNLLDMVTINAAKILRLNTGSIEIGKKADLVLLNAKSSQLHPLINVVSNIIYSCNSSCVSDVICNGKIIMKEKRILTFDEEQIIKKVEERNPF